MFTPNHTAYNSLHINPHPLHQQHVENFQHHYKSIITSDTSQKYEHNEPIFDEFEYVDDMYNIEVTVDDIIDMFNGIITI